MKPVYMINGFLESGKTEFITFTLEQPYFQIKGKTLLILCEEGEIEYDAGLLNRSRTDMERIEKEDDFTTARLMEFEKKYRPERIIIEYNGIWNFKKMKLPRHWSVEQQVTTIDASTFPVYFNNMKSLLAEMVRESELIIFNRCDDVEELSSYRRNIKAINQNADIVFENTDGEIDEAVEGELPYNLNDGLIELNNQSYGIWYLDILEHIERYIGKSVCFTAMVLKPSGYPKGFFVPGRMAMTCCAEDMTFLGFACAYDGIDSLTDKQWVKVTAIVRKEYFANYNSEGPVLNAVSVVPEKAPIEEIISFV